MPDFFLVAATRDLPLERFRALALGGEVATKRFLVFVVDGEFMIMRTELTRLGLKPSLRPISSADGTRFVITYVGMETL